LTTPLTTIPPSVARSNWRRSDVPLRVVAEPALGLTFARICGISVARYEYVSFVDDDNRVGKEWVSQVIRVMTSDRFIGACGGLNRAVSDAELPWWFDSVAASYAVGPQGEFSGDVADARTFLWGAGLTIRRSAWLALSERGFSLSCSDRSGSALSSGGDSELCLDLRRRNASERSFAYIR
jgi:cellulose synthase/poly-beta-1,6-N-acetylglucosamine synthase-like glycosyltransferase